MKKKKITQVFERAHYLMKTLNNEDEIYNNQSFIWSVSHARYKRKLSIRQEHSYQSKRTSFKKGVTLKKIYTDWIVECLERETSQTSLNDLIYEKEDNNVELEKKQLRSRE